MTLRKFSSKILYSIVAVGLLFSTACKKDSNGGGGVIDPGTKKLVKLEEDANNHATFEYNADGTIKKVISVETGEAGAETSIINIAYNADKTVKEVTTDEGSVLKYVYANNRLVKTESHMDDELTGFNEYSYQGGKLAMITAMYLTEDEEGEPINMPFMKTEFTYLGSGDIKEVTVSLFNPMTELFEIASVRKFEQYDNKPNPLSQLSFLNMGYFANLSNRNPLVEKAYDGEGNLEETIQNVYTYDAQGFPLTCKTTTTPAGGTAEVTNMKYHYN